MKYRRLAEYYERLESTTKNLEKIDIVAELFREAKKEDLEILALAVMGQVFPEYSEQEIGIASKLMRKVIASAYGVSEEEVLKHYRDSGDLGLTAEHFAKNKRQRTLGMKELTVEKVFENIRKLPEITGARSQERKIGIIKELLVSSSPKEAKYIVRTILGEMRVGVGEGTVRDAIAKAFGVSPQVVEDAYNLLTDYGEVALIAKEKGEEGLKNVSLQIGKPIRVMLAESTSSMEEALEKAENPALEYKYDGMRSQIHIKGDKIWIFTRRLEDVTEQFPDLVEMVRESVKSKECIIEGETIGLTPDRKKLVPFQKLSRRIKRKYGIEEMAKKIPVKLELFDAIYINGKNLMGMTQKERREALERIVNEVKGKVALARQLVTKDLDEANKFFDEAIREGEEGVMVKNQNAVYKPGKRVGYWYKVKSVMETLDLVIVRAEWGHGKRSGWLSSYTLACRDPETNELKTVGKMASGLTEEQLEDMTERLKDLIIGEKDREVIIKPKIVVEVMYNEIQKSPTYESGFALRFPRLKQIREDKSPHEADTIERISRLYEQQKGKSPK